MLSLQTGLVVANTTAMVVLRQDLPGSEFSQAETTPHVRVMASHVSSLPTDHILVVNGSDVVVLDAAASPLRASVVVATVNPAYGSLVVALAGHVDADGRSDVITFQEKELQLHVREVIMTIYLQQRSGEYALSSSTTLDSFDKSAVALLDLNGDGLDDLFYVFGGQLIVAWNTGGHFNGTTATLGACSSNTQLIVRTARLTRSGLADLVYADLFDHSVRTYISLNVETKNKTRVENKGRKGQNWNEEEEEEGEEGEGEEGGGGGGGEEEEEEEERR